MDSPYQKHLGTNYTPTTSEARGIQLFIDGTAQGLVALDSQIEIVRRQLDLLQERRSAMHDFVEQHRALLSPIRKLTPDILEVIFLACLPSDRNPCMSATEAPMLLTRICGAWRQIAMFAPRLWAAIHIVLPNVALEPHPTGTDSEVAMHQALLYSALDRREIAVSEWLGRSGVCPLSISIFEEFPWPGNGGDGANATTLWDLQKRHLSFIVNTILPYHQQWREFDVCLAEDTLDGVLGMGLKAGSLRALKSLHITRKFSFYHPQLAPKHHWIDAVALLPPHAISATFVDLIAHPSDFPSIPLHAWQGLTELNLSLYDAIISDSTIDVNNFTAEILFHCHSLVTLTLCIDCSDPVGGSSSRTEKTDKIILPRVTTLNIALPPSSEGVAFAKRLFIPSLTEMNVQFSRYGQSVEIFQQLLGSLLLSGGHILTLNLCAHRWMGTSDDLVCILRMAPDVKCLTISSKGIYTKWGHTARYPASQSNIRDVVTDNLLQSLSPSKDDIICPMLEEFVCSQDLITGITEGGLKIFLKARKLDPSVANIRRISVFINETKREPVLGEERISLGTDSAVYFKTPTHISLSPFGGYIESERKFNAHVGTSDSEVYTEL